MFVRHLPDRPELVEAANAVATRLLALTDALPESWGLVLAGSFARGEPCWRRDLSGGLIQVSDIDLVVIASAAPDAHHDLIDMAVGLERIGAFTLTPQEYHEFGSELGYGIKTGMWLGAGPPPVVTPPVPTVADAYESFVGALLEWFARDSTSTTAAIVDEPASYDVVMDEYHAHRSILYLLNSAARLYGRHSYHDFEGLDPDLVGAFRRALSWRDDPSLRLEDAHDEFLAALDVGWQAHVRDGRAATFQDAVTDTERDNREGSDFVKRLQRLASMMAAEMVERHRRDPSRPLAVLERDAFATLAADWPGEASVHQVVASRLSPFKDAQIAIKGGRSGPRLEGATDR